MHAWGAHDPPNLGEPDAPHGYGVLLWFQTEAFGAAVARARAMHADVIKEPFVNPNARHLESWMRDLDGYVVVLASRDGDVD